MSVFHVLRDSFNLLLKKPKIFLPNLFASSLYAFSELVLVKVSIDIMSMVQYSPVYPPMEDLRSSLLVFLGVLLFFPVIGVIDLVTYSMYPAIVADYNSGGVVSLRKAFRDALSAWRVWLALGVIFLFFAFFVFVLIGIFAVVAFVLNNLLILFIGAVLFIILVLLFMLVVFFVMPVGVIEKSGIVESFRESFSLGLKHPGEVVFLNVFILVVVIAAFLAGNLMGVERISLEITLLAVVLFLLVRFIQSIIYTYVCVVNPYFYVRVSRK
ncbi:MAG: hypothetical protein JW778_05490 [Candidatus Altiarchaeota archaeon]|nr:hypothetical protein [Candidatus Altiarchaeota archaeon]